MLVMVTLLWGFSFPLVKTWQEASQRSSSESFAPGAASCPGGDFSEVVSSLTILAIRMLVAVVLLAIWKPALVSQPTRREHGFGAVLGVLMFLSLGLQFWGMVYASPAISAFLTSLGSAWVPIFAFVLFRILVPRLTMLGLLIGVTGVAVLTLKPANAWRFGPGETLTLLSTIPFALQILILDRVGRKVNSEHLTVSLFLSTGGLALIVTLMVAMNGEGIAIWLDWVGEMLSQTDIILTIIALVLMPTILAFLWMNQYQPQVPPGQAALVYLLEPIFTTLISVPWGHDELSFRLAIGGALVLLGNLLVDSR